MLVLVLGELPAVTFLGWEGVGLCSYLLVSFWFERNAAAVAGKKAFVTNRVGDFGFMLAMFLDLPEARARSTTRRSAPRRRDLLAVGRSPRSRCCSSSARWQERAGPAAHLAARRDGGPDPGLGADPRRDDGHRRRVPARAGRTRSSTRRTDAAHGRRRGSARSPRCFAATVALVQNDIKTGARVLDDQPARLHVPRGRRRARTAPRSST